MQHYLETRTKSISKKLAVSSTINISTANYATTTLSNKFATRVENSTTTTRIKRRTTAKAATLRATLSTARIKLALVKNPHTPSGMKTPRHSKTWQPKASASGVPPQNAPIQTIKANVNTLPQSPATTAKSNRGQAKATSRQPASEKKETPKDICHLSNTSSMKPEMKKNP